MAWGRHKLNAESAQIEHYRIENIDVRLASVASAGADLSELERAAEDPMGLFSKTIRQSQRFSFAKNQIVPVAGRESILRSETDRALGTCVGALGAKQTATEIDSQTSVAGDCIGRAGVRRNSRNRKDIARYPGSAGRGIAPVESAQCREMPECVCPGGFE